MCSHLPLLCTLSQLNLSNNQLCGVDVLGKGTYNAEGIKAIADALLVAGSLTELVAWDNNLGDEGEAALRKAVEGRAGFELML